MRENAKQSPDVLGSVIATVYFVVYKYPYNRTRLFSFPSLLEHVVSH